MRTFVLQVQRILCRESDGHRRSNSSFATFGLVSSKVPNQVSPGSPHFQNNAPPAPASSSVQCFPKALRIYS